MFLVIFFLRFSKQDAQELKEKINMIFDEPMTTPEEATDETSMDEGTTEGGDDSSSADEGGEEM